MRELFDWFQVSLGLLGVLFLGGIFLALVALVVRKRTGGRGPGEGRLKITHINEKFLEARESILRHTLDKKSYKAYCKERDKADKESTKDAAALSARKQVFVVDFEGDISASKVSGLREQVTALLGILRSGDEVVVRLESPGGMVHGYGLAASQLARFKQKPDCTLTVCVDKVAASGGYMMACTATKIVAAPFAIVGSIGVVASLPNFNRLMKKNDIDYYELTAGDYKRTVSVFGEITDKGRAKFLEQLEETHVLFKDFIAHFRPVVDLVQTATGEHWYGTRALELKLVDALETSDDYLVRATETAEVYHIDCSVKETIKDRIAHLFSSTFEGFAEGVASRVQRQRLG